MRGVLFVLALAASLLPVSAQAQTPSDLRDLVDARASSGESELQSRGYVHISSQRGDDRSYSNWWKQASHTCVTVSTMEGRFSSITTTTASDCNQSGHHGSSDAAVGAAVAVGAAAILAGAIASSHRSHHHEDGQHSNDPSYEQDFERGHRDGLYNHSYDNHNDTAGYIAGYQSGVEQRDHESSYRAHSGRHDSGYSARPTRDFASLNGARGSSTDDTLTGWGFRSVDNTTSGDARYGIWYNRSTGECVQVITADGRSTDVRDIQTHPACR